MTLTTFETDGLAAMVALLSDYAQGSSTPLQVYPGRPRTVYAPSAFVNDIAETITYDGLRQRNLRVELVVLHAEFDSAEAVAQVVMFRDGFVNYVRVNESEAGPGTQVWVSEITTLQNFVAEWLPESQQVPYYGSRIVVEGLSD